MKIIASDYDGTLRRPHVGVIDKDREAIKRWRKVGNLFGVVTGRGSGMERELERENVEFDFVIVFNGTEIVDNKGNILSSHKGDGSRLYEMLPVMLNKEGDWIDIVTKKRSYYVTYEDKEIEKRDTWVKCEDVKNIKEFVQIYALRKTEEDALKTAGNLNKDFSNAVSALVNGDWLNIAPPGVTKSSGIMEYAQIKNVDKENIFTIGDSFNDIDMIKTFNGYSVLNGTSELKKAARKICDGIYALAEEQI